MTRSAEARVLVVSACLVVLCMTAAAGSAQVDTTRIPYTVVAALPGEQCLVCGAPLTAKDIALIVKGRRVPLDHAHIEKFIRNKDMYFARLQPKAALFQEDLDVPPGTAQGGIASGWFLFGLWVLTALICGGLSAYNAIAKGLKPLRFFFVGLVLNVPGYLYVLTRPPRADEARVPPGLVKVPLTSAPRPCPRCGNMNHPTAIRCAICKAELHPETPSEVSKVL